MKMSKLKLTDEIDGQYDFETIQLKEEIEEQGKINEIVICDVDKCLILNND